jgi:hypothetical protein
MILWEGTLSRLGKAADHIRNVHYVPKLLDEKQRVADGEMIAVDGTSRQRRYLDDCDLVDGWVRVWRERTIEREEERMERA